MASWILHICYCELLEAYKKIYDEYKKTIVDYGKSWCKQLLKSMYLRLESFPEHNHEFYTKELEKYKVEE